MTGLDRGTKLGRPGIRRGPWAPEWCPPASDAAIPAASHAEGSAQEIVS